MIAGECNRCGWKTRRSERRRREHPTAKQEVVWWHWWRHRLTHLWGGGGWVGRETSEPLREYRISAFHHQFFQCTAPFTTPTPAHSRMFTNLPTRSLTLHTLVLTTRLPPHPHLLPLIHSSLTHSSFTLLSHSLFFLTHSPLSLTFLSHPLSSLTHFPLTPCPLSLPHLHCSPVGCRRGYQRDARGDAAPVLRTRVPDSSLSLQTAVRPMRKYRERMHICVTF